MKRILYGGMALSLLFAACNNAEKKEAVAKEDILVTNRDTTVNPADDFFEYANGGWIKANPIPAEETSWGIAYLVQNELYNRLLHINEEALKKSC